MPTTLVLVRHGEANAGVGRVIGGPKGCTGLTPRGRRQAEQLRDRLAAGGEFVPDVMFASVLPRAIETANILRDAFDPVPIVTTDCEYCELHPGEADGLPVDEYERRYGAIDDPDPERELSPGGESQRTFDARVRRATKALIDAHRDCTIMLVTHGGFVMGATRFLLGAPPVVVGVFGHQPQNTSLNVFVESDVSDDWFLERYNDHRHLIGE